MRRVLKRYTADRHEPPTGERGRWGVWCAQGSHTRHGQGRSYRATAYTGARGGALRWPARRESWWAGAGTPRGDTSAAWPAAQAEAAERERGETPWGS